jgi:hypothetical protein
MVDQSLIHSKSDNRSPSYYQKLASKFNSKLQLLFIISPSSTSYFQLNQASRGLFNFQKIELSALEKEFELRYIELVGNKIKLDTPL